jgi:hypothetical protein
MEIAFDSNGYPYDTSTNLLVNVEYDVNGNAIDSNTGQIIQTVIMPDNATVYKTGPGSGTNWANLFTVIAQQLTRPPRIPIYQPGYYPSGYPTGYPTGVGGTLGASSSGVGGSLTISPTTLLLIGVVAFAFLFGRKGR